VLEFDKDTDSEEFIFDDEMTVSEAKHVSAGTRW
jgi:hypothetical protein